jgi:acetyl-CoA acetyltransferase
MVQHEFAFAGVHMRQEIAYCAEGVRITYTVFRQLRRQASRADSSELYLLAIGFRGAARSA